MTTLTYWNGRGRAETIRLFLAVCGEEYTEHVPGFDASVTHLSEPEHFESLRDGGYLAFGSVPLLCIDGMKLVQTQAIVRYLAAKHGLRGNGSPADVVLFLRPGDPLAADAAPRGAQLAGRV